jgi:hypothetical protein
MFSVAKCYWSLIRPDLLSMGFRSPAVHPFWFPAKEPVLAVVKGQFIQYYWAAFQRFLCG